MSKRTLSLITSLIFITAILVAIAFFQENSPTASTTMPAIPIPTDGPIAQTTLSLYPNPLLTSSTSASLNVEIDSKQNPVTAVQLELSYSNDAISNIDVFVPKDDISFFQKPTVMLKRVDEKLGKISFATAVSPTQKSKKGIGTVAIISFVMKGSTNSAEISFLPKTLVAAVGTSASVLQKSTGATIILDQKILAPKQATTGAVQNSPTPSL